jgi:hypothetical protein
LNILLSIEHLLTITSSLKDWFYFVLSLICIYDIYRNIYREKVIMSGGIANQRARATGAWEEEEHCWIIIRGVSGLFSPKLEPCCRSSLEASVSVESSLKVCYNSMSLDTVHLLFFNLSERALDSRSVEQRFLLCILLFFGLSNLGDEDTDSCMIFFHQPLLIFFIESWLTNQCSLEI